MSRIREAFTMARETDRAAFVAYVTAGDPSPERTLEVARGLIAAGIDVLELGVPFSDPIADGPTNQLAAERALAAGTTLQDVLAIVTDLRAESQVPVVLFTYANPVVRMGIGAFAGRAREAGVDGVLFTDVPLEEYERFTPALRDAQLDPVMLVTPTSDRARIKAGARASGGFLYLVSRTGVTGARKALDRGLADLVKSVRRAARLPVAVGFGISTPEQVAEVASLADGVVVGSAIVNRIADHGDADGLGAAVETFTRPLVEATRRDS
jgi:tryptophan synthase alpha chain